METEILKQLAENLSNLTVLECYQIAKIMKEQYGIEPNTKVMGINISPLPTTVMVVEKTTFDVVLKSTGMNKLPVMRLIKEMTGMSLLEIKTIVENVPSKLKENVSKDEAITLQETLKEIGADVEVL